MMNELSKDPFLNKSVQHENHLRQAVKFFEGLLTPNMTILDIGPRSPMTDALEIRYGVKIHNTEGDLDEAFTATISQADAIIYSHTIEHQFNPLLTLQQIKTCMKPTSLLYILLPSRGKLLWDKGHYHEIDNYRMKLLIDRSGLRIVKYERLKHWRAWYDYLKGFRMLLRAVVEYNAFYTISK